jgi:flagellar biosynthesis protein FliP
MPVSPRIRLLARLVALVGTLALLLAVPALAGAAEDPSTVNVQVPAPGSDPGTTIGLLGLFTLITLGPSVLIMMTGFTRILIVLGFLRQAMGTPSLPPNQILIGISIFLTIFVMGPTFSTINETALQPYLDQQIDAQEAIDNAAQPLRAFMLKQTGNSELEMFVNLSRQEPPETADDIPLTTLIPAFMISEIKTAFMIGFLVYVPFLIIDLVISSTLMSMGMMMLPPVLISLPFKILLFVLVDGWHLVSESLVRGFVS